MENINNINEQELQSVYEKYFGENGVNMKYWGPRQVRMLAVDGDEATRVTLNFGVTPYDVYKALEAKKTHENITASLRMTVFAPWFKEHDNNSQNDNTMGPMIKSIGWFKSDELKEFLDKYTRPVLNAKDNADWESVGTLGTYYNGVSR